MPIFFVIMSELQLSGGGVTIIKNVLIEICLNWAQGVRVRASWDNVLKSAIFFLERLPKIRGLCYDSAPIMTEGVQNFLHFSMHKHDSGIPI